METSKATADACDLKLVGALRLFSEQLELIHVPLDAFQGQCVTDGGILGRDRKAATLKAIRLPENGTTMVQCELGCACSMETSFITSETRRSLT